jgi:hypothetical protein
MEIVWQKRLFASFTYSEATALSCVLALFVKMLAEVGENAKRHVTQERPVT